MSRMIIYLAAIVAGVATPDNRGQGAAAIPVATPAEKRMAHISIVEMRRGDSIYLIPGVSSLHAVRDGTAPEIAKNRKVLLVQVSGFGGDDPGANPTPGVAQGIIADILAVAAARDAQKPVPTNHGDGGPIGTMIAARHPDDVETRLYRHTRQASAVPGSYHFIVLDQPGPFGRAVQDFLTE